MAGSNARPPLRRDAERNRRRILEAAGALVGDHGLDISHDEIARVAQVGVGTVYRRFPTREALFDELFSAQLDAIVAVAEEAGELEDPWMGICQFLERYFEQQVADRGLRELLLGHRGGTELARRAQSRVLPVVTKLVARAHAAGRLHPAIGPTDFAIIPVMISPVITASNEAAPDLWRRWLAVVLDGIARGPRIDELPGRAPAPDQVERILGANPPSRSRSGRTAPATPGTTRV